MRTKQAQIVELAEVLPRPKGIVVLFNTTHQTLMVHAIDGHSSIWIQPKGRVELQESELSPEILAHLVTGRLMRIDP